MKYEQLLSSSLFFRCRVKIIIRLMPTSIRVNESNFTSTACLETHKYMHIDHTLQTMYFSMYNVPYLYSIQHATQVQIYYVMLSISPFVV